ncbi:MAG: Arm DNA-binding domain-containing protein [Cardiobacteriaceae bacterium]|nr:Arm DNA-binding domain-containing protein [Cardiobacteriaceae bacterium]
MAWSVSNQYKRKRASYGVYPAVSLKQAREKHAIMRLPLSNGIDSNLSKRKTKQSALQQVLFKTA